jgi:hypothetical protein
MLSPAKPAPTPDPHSPGVLDQSQVLPDAQSSRALVDLDTDRSANDDHAPGVGVDSPDGSGQPSYANQAAHADPSEALLLIMADALDDLERQRIASENRLRSLGQVKGLQGSRAEAKLAVLTDALADLEHQATLELQRALRTHPLGPWVKQTVGIGEKQGARLIAAIGDPAWNYAEDRPRRGPAELWAYCGYVPGQKRRKGVKSNWNTQAKMRAFLCAESCMKNRRSPFREVYDRERLKWADREVSDGHKHAHALRVVAKEILKDLWRYAAKERSTPRSSSPAATDLQAAIQEATPIPYAPPVLSPAIALPTPMDRSPGDLEPTVNRTTPIVVSSAKP